jgi:hypothetical protein
VGFSPRGFTFLQPKLQNVISTGMNPALRDECSGEIFFNRFLDFARNDNRTLPAGNLMFPVEKKIANG